MKLPFSIQQFLKIFEEYNLYFWPLQFAFYLLAILAVLLSLRKWQRSGQWVTTILAFFWIWMGIVYHPIYFSAINKAAFIFGIAFILQAILFFYFGLIKKRLSFNFSKDIYGITGTVFIFYALVIYPFLGNLYGHSFPAAASFGLPCPTTVFTFGILLLAEKKIPIGLLIIPVAWSIFGFSASLLLGIKEDTGLIIASLVFILLIAHKNKRANKIIQFN